MCTVFSASAAGFVLDRLADPPKPGVSITWDTYTWASQRSLLWWSIDLKQGTASISAGPACWIMQQDVCIMWYRRLVRSGFNPETLTGMQTSLSVDPRAQWLTCWSSVEIHQCGNKAQQSKHLIPPGPPLACAQIWMHGLGRYVYGMVWIHSPDDKDGDGHWNIGNF